MQKSNRTRSEGIRHDSFVLNWTELWDEFGTFYCDRINDTGAERSQGNVDNEFLFCLLGGHGVTFELARSAVAVLSGLEIFKGDWSVEELEAVLATELAKPQFQPVRRDGSLRRYRYPRRKARLIARAAAWVAQRGPLREAILTLNDDEARRDFLCECPGVGLKTASWLLRNIGLGESLAIIDVHVLRALTAARRIREARLPKDYRRVEQRFLKWCEELGAPPAAFDLMLWEWQRTL